MWGWNVVAGLALLHWLFALLADRQSRRWIRPLPTSSAGAAPADDRLPLVSVIVAAKEEEAGIGNTIRHLLSQTHPRLEIVAVNDRSADGTGAMLDELKRWSEGKRESPVPLTVIHIRNLPGGWLGKNHALYQGYRQAKGRYLLFTDADIRYAPTTIADAVAYMQAHEVDHLSLTPHMEAKSFWLRAFVQIFLFSLAQFTGLWRANDDSTRKYGTGVGAFNLLTRAAYETVGTHRALAMRPDGDLQLGRTVKAAGFRQRLLVGKDRLSVEWYPSFRAAAQGLEKNIFAGFHYRLSIAVAALLGQLLVFLLPFVGIWFAGPWAAFAFGASIATMMTLYLSSVRTLSRDSGLEAIVFPASVLLLVYVMARAVALACKRNGIYWRGTFYSLNELKRSAPPS